MRWYLLEPVLPSPPCWVAPVSCRSDLTGTHCTRLQEFLMGRHCSLPLERFSVLLVVAEWHARPHPLGIAAAAAAIVAIVAIIEAVAVSLPAVATPAVAGKVLGSSTLLVPAVSEVVRSTSHRPICAFSNSACWGGRLRYQACWTLQQCTGAYFGLCKKETCYGCCFSSFWGVI